MKKLTCCVLRQTKTDSFWWMSVICEIGLILSLYLSLCLSFHSLIHHSTYQSNHTFKWFAFENDHKQTNQPWMPECQEKKKSLHVWFKISLHHETFSNITECGSSVNVFKKKALLRTYICTKVQGVQTCMGFKLHFLLETLILWAPQVHWI